MRLRILMFLILSLAACTPRSPSTPGPDSPVTSPPQDPGATDEPLINPLAPKPGDESLTRGNAYLDEASLVIRESFPPQISLMLKGNLPTPCSQLRVAVSPPDQENRIMLDVYSLIDPDQGCAQVLQPFEESVDLGSFPTGHYTVWVNGEPAGEFDS